MAIYVHWQSGSLLNQNQYESLCFLLKITYRLKITKEDTLREVIRGYTRFPSV